MRGEEFRARAVHEGQRYGEDKMVFLRELAQNARDAGARRIDVSTERSGGEILIRFRDDGAGMSLGHARKYLFTLYASSKEWETQSAGRFGVGFWSVLLFQPSSFEIESKARKRRGWRIAMDGSLTEPKLLSCRLKAVGTAVEIKKPVSAVGGFERASSDVAAALARYCRYLRRNDKRATPLPVFFNGALVSEPFKLDGPCWMTFNDGRVEGAVGLGSDPKVELFARGLPVWRGTVLEELRYSASPVKDDRHPEGLAPVYLLCGNNLNVTLDRRAVVDDGALDAVRRKARQRMRELLWLYLDEVSPRGFFSRMSDRFGALFEDLRLSNYLFGKVVLFLAPLLAAAAGMIVFNATRPDLREERPETLDMAPGSSLGATRGLDTGRLQIPSRAPLGNPTMFGGPTISPVRSGDRLPLKFSPPGARNFRLAAYENLHSGFGIVGSKPLLVAGDGDFVCENDCLEVEVEISADSGALLIPVPTGYAVEKGSASLDGRALKKLGMSASGEPMAELEGDAQGTLRYRTGPADTVIEAAHRERLKALPAHMNPPDELKRAVSRASKIASVEERVEELRRFVEQRVSYDASPAAFRAYDAFLKRDPKAGWLDFVLTYARGDCDVKNTLLVVLLRLVGVPARLAVGVVGADGRAVEGVHAWVEYLDDRWREADATGGGGAEDISLTAAGGAVIEGASEMRESLDEAVEPGAEISFYDRLGPLLPVAGVTVLAALAVCVVLLAMAGRPNDLFAPGDEERKREVAAEMLTNAMTHPEAWQKGGGIAARRLLPVIGRRRGMSLSEALDRGLKGTLWYSGKDSDFEYRAVKSGARILDASDQIFGPLVKRLPGIIDLDEVARLKPTAPAQLSGELAGVARMIERMNLLLHRAGFKTDIILPCEGLGETMARDVVLTGLLKTGSRRPVCFVAVNPHSIELGEKAALADETGSLAAFHGLALLIRHSDLLASARERIMRTAALAVIEEAG